MTTLDVELDISRASSKAVGAAHGVSPQDLTDIAPQVLRAHALLTQQRSEKKYGFYDLYKDTATQKDIKDTAAALRDRKIENLVVLGIGGSALGTRALVTALKPPFYNLLSRARRVGAPRIFVMDNIDPVTFRQMLKLCPPHKTLYNVISKSGDTAEPMSQLMIVIEAIEKKLGAAAMKEHLIATTNNRQEKASLLHPIADHYGLKTFPIPLNVGGRFSVFSPVGMFPAAVLGLDLDALCAGCEAMDRRCSAPSLEENPAYLHAVVQYLEDTQKGKSMSVMMPYADALRDVADWYRQLWSESLGKRHSLDGQEIFTGQTPIKALGVTDQHSQIQLYREGPNNKLINVLEVKRFAKTLRIPNTLTFAEPLAYLRGQTMNKLMAAELRGTIDALKASNRPVVKITLPTINEHTLAQLLYLFEVETALAGQLYNVDTFNQPGVEEGKKIARSRMGGQG